MQRRILFFSLLVLVLAAVGCTRADDSPAQDNSNFFGPPGEEETFAPEDPAVAHDLEGWSEDDFAKGVVADKAVSCTSRYTPRASYASRANNQNVSYDSVGSSCSGGATQGARQLGTYIRDHFGSLLNLSIPGNGIQIYNCRNVRGSSGRSMHSEGRAVDIFFPVIGGTADNSKGDTVADWLIANAEHIGIQMLIWDRTIWYANRAPQSRCYKGRHPHNDHIHVELTREAAALDSPFFRALAANTQGAPDEANQRAPWLGTPCSTNQDCDFVHNGATGVCVRDGVAANGKGLCATACEGYCPDRGGFAPTFCAETSDVGMTSIGAGACIQRSHNHNDSCTAYANTTESQADRHIGRSGASASRTEVCALNQDAPVTDPTPDPDPDPNPNNCGDVDYLGKCDGTVAQWCEDNEIKSRDCATEGKICGFVDDTTGNYCKDADQPNPTGNDICEDTSLPVSDNGLSCDGFSENHWRCACSENLETSISQVCRNGNWINYQTNPSDCSACNGSYGPGCEPGTTEPDPEPTGNDVCEDTSLPLSNNGLSCDGFAENHWRCACSGSLEVTVSQVCRGGSWVNYQTNPSDCSACDGSYSRGCEP